MDTKLRYHDHTQASHFRQNVLTADDVPELELYTP